MKQKRVQNWKTSLLSAAKQNIRFLFSTPLLSVVVAISIVGPVVAKAVAIKVSVSISIGVGISTPLAVQVDVGVGSISHGVVAIEGVVSIGISLSLGIGISIRSSHGRNKQGEENLKEAHWSPLDEDEETYKELHVGGALPTVGCEPQSCSEDCLAVWAFYTGSTLH